MIVGWADFANVEVLWSTSSMVVLRPVNGQLAVLLAWVVRPEVKSSVVVLEPWPTGTMLDVMLTEERRRERKGKKRRDKGIGPK